MSGRFDHSRIHLFTSVSLRDRWISLA